MSNHETIGERIQKIRLEKGIKLSELADRSSVAKSYLSNVERNIQKNPSISLLQKIANALNVSVHMILYGEAYAGELQADPEWVQLMQEAVLSGVSKSQFKEFIEFQKWKNGQQQK